MTTNPHRENQQSQITLMILVMVVSNLVGCNNTGTAEIWIQSVQDGKMHKKQFIDTSEIWHSAVESISFGLEADSTYGTFANGIEYIHGNDDTSIAITIKNDTFAFFNHIHINTEKLGIGPNCRFYGLSFPGSPPRRCFISCDMKNKITNRIRAIQFSKPVEIDTLNEWEKIQEQKKNQP